ncbi:MAG: hypothetical protein LBT84_07530 [Spirochaetia bacterium]|jgi:hypothetical protein|nr:hypothetical protein [Spirochaetia bacterium]
MRKTTACILFALPLFFSLCSKDKGAAEIRAYLNEVHDELIEYEKNMLRAQNGEEAAAAITAHYSKLLKFAERSMLLDEKYPEAAKADELSKQGDEIAALTAEVDKKTAPVLDKYMGHPAVLEALYKMIDGLQKKP